MQQESSWRAAHPLQPERFSRLKMNMCSWRVFILGGFILGRFILDRFILGGFILGKFILGRFILGGFILDRFQSGKLTTSFQPVSSQCSPIQCETDTMGTNVLNMLLLIRSGKPFL